MILSTVRSVKKIYIVTDRQDPHLDRPLAEALPEGHIPMEIIDHKVIFRGYEEYLPTFNSRAIETLIWRIPGLSERFLLMNDDFMFIGKAIPEDVFKEHEDLIIRNIHHKFRNAEQFNSQELFFISESREGRCKVINTDTRLVYLNPKKKKGYIDRKLSMFERRKGAIFCCVNALSLAERDEQMKIMDWVRNRIYQNLHPSP